MRKSEQNNSNLDLIFKPPKKLTFNKLYRMYFDDILRLMYRVVILKNVPPTIDETFLKMILFTQGKIVFFKGQQVGASEPELLALNCSRANMPTVYYLPSQFLVTNPRLLKSYTLTPGIDCEVVYLSETDKYNLAELNGGLFELISRTATMLADSDLSLNIAQKNTRLTNITAAQTQNAFDSLCAVINAMYDGDPNIVVKSSLIEQLQNIPIMNNTNNQHLLQLIEVNQYILAHFFEKIGFCTHDQMKRERLVTGEVNDNFDLARFNIDDMIKSLNDGFNTVNSHFGTEIEAVLNPIIEQQREKLGGALPLRSGQLLPLPAYEEEAADDQEEEAADQTEEEAADDQEEEAADQTEEEAAEQPEEEAADDQEEEAADQTEEEAADDQEEEAADQTEEEAAEQPEEEAADDQEEEAADDQEEEVADQTEEEAADDQQNNTIEINGDNNVIIIGGEENAIDERSDAGGASADMDGNTKNNVT